MRNLVVPRILPTLDRETLAGLQAEANEAEAAFMATILPTFEPVDVLLARNEEIR